jgi:TonB family protein
MQIGKWIKYLAAVVITATLATASACAQAASSSDTGRKVKSKSAPVYPELARHMGVTGRVKLEIVITPDGRVKSTRVIGGHPILVQACQDVVKDWKFVSAPEETTQVVEFEFRDQQ